MEPRLPDRSVRGRPIGQVSPEPWRAASVSDPSPTVSDQAKVKSSSMGGTMNTALLTTVGVGLLLLLLEYGVVKRWFEGRTDRQAGARQDATHQLTVTGDHNDVRQTVDNRAYVIRKTTHVHRSAPARDRSQEPAEDPWPFMIVAVVAGIVVLTGLTLVLSRFG